MNYEELLETRDVRKTTKVRLPYGYFYKRLIDGKYSNFVEFHDEVADNIAFNSCVRNECDALSGIESKYQLRFTPNEGDDGVYAIAVEVGNYVPFDQLLNENPSVIAQKNYITETIHALVELTTELNEKGIYHVCFAPSNVLARKNDATVRLLCHGSHYLRLDQETIYEGVEDYVAPEVLNQSTADARSDVYSLAKFIAWLYQSAGLPFELKHVIAKATDPDPARRYASVAALASAINTSRGLRRTGTLAASAIAIALVCLGLFFYMLPSPENVEFVPRVEDPVTDEMLEDDYEAVLGIGADADSAAIAALVRQQQLINDSLGIDDKKMREYQAKAEQIFRKQFTKEADNILNKVYNNTTMNATEKDFISRSTAMTEELAAKTDELSKATGLTAEHAQSIASKIIDQLTEKKKAALEKDYYGIKNKSDNEE